MPLFWRIFTMNAIALVAVLVLLPSPWVTVSASMLFGVIAMLVTGALPSPWGSLPAGSSDPPRDRGSGSPVAGVPGPAHRSR